MTTRNRNSAVYNIWNPFFWLTIMFTTKAGWEAMLGFIIVIAKVSLLIWFILIMDDIATTQHQINESLMEIRNG